LELPKFWQCQTFSTQFHQTLFLGSGAARLVLRHQSPDVGILCIKTVLAISRHWLKVGNDNVCIAFQLATVELLA